MKQTIGTAVIIVGLVVIALIIIVVVFAQQSGHTSTATIQWDEYVSILGESPDDWQAWMDFELRQDAKVLSSRTRLTDCEASLDPNVGDCGGQIEATWGSLDEGDYEVWSRLRWTDGNVEIFGEPATRVISDTNGFWLWERFKVQTILLPSSFR